MTQVLRKKPGPKPKIDETAPKPVDVEAIKARCLNEGTIAVLSQLYQKGLLFGLIASHTMMKVPTSYIKNEPCSETESKAYVTNLITLLLNEYNPETVSSSLTFVVVLGHPMLILFGETIKNRNQFVIDNAKKELVSRNG